MNAVVLSVGVMLIFSLLRINVVMSLISVSMVAGLSSDIGIIGALNAFNSGTGGGANVALSYGLLGAFALALAESGLPYALTDWLQKKLIVGQERRLRNWLIVAILLLSIASQNILPIHIAFIPLIIPPLLLMMTNIQLDRRLIACVITFGLITPYMLFPVGFGEIFLKQILLANLSKAGLDTRHLNVSHAMWLPSLGMLFGLLTATFISYRRPRHYATTQLKKIERENVKYSAYSLWLSVAAIAVMLIVQLWLNSIMLGSLGGFIVLIIGKVIRWKKIDTIFSQGLRIMAGIGLIMIAASGFAEVLKQTGHIPLLVADSVNWMAGNKGLAALIMLLIGMLVTIGVGSSFSTVPIIAALYVPMAIEMGFSVLATVALVGTAGALGDAGSPVSDSTLGPTAGLNIDGQHDHIWGSVIPTFIHYNIPLLVMGWIATMVL